MQSERARALLISVFLVLVCLYFLPSFKNAFSLPKDLLLYLAAALLVSIPLLQAALKEGTSLRIKAGFLPLLCIVVLFFASLLYTPSPHAATRELLSWLACFIVFVSAAQLSGKDIRAVTAAGVAAGAVMGGIAILQYFFHDPLPLAGGQYRIYATLGNPNYVGGYLAIAVPAGAGLLLYPGEGKRKSRAALSVALAVCCVALAASGARGAMLGAWMGVLALSAAVLWRRTRPSKWPVAAVIALALVSALAAGTLILRAAGPEKDSVNWRRLAWRGVARMAAERPLMGWGAGSLNLQYLDFQADVLDDNEDPGIGKSATGILSMAHNEYLQLAAEEGIPASILFVVLIVVCAAEAFRAGPEGFGAGAAVLSAAVLSLTNFPLRLAATAYPFFVFAGLCLCSQRPFKTVEIRVRGRAERCGLALAAAGLVAWTIGYSAMRLQAEALFTRGVRHYYENRPGQALSLFREALAKEPHDGVTRFYAGSCLSKMKRREEAIREIRRSLETHVEMNSLLELGTLLAVTGREEEAVDLLMKCTRIIPGDPRPRFGLGYALFRKGDFRGAIAAYEETLRLDANYPEARKNLELAVMEAGQKTNNQ